MLLMSEQLSSAVVSCQQLFSHCDRRKSMIETSCVKVCLTKCSGNCLEIYFEYSHVSVAQKLTELRIFGCQGNWGHFLVMTAVYFGS